MACARIGHMKSSRSGHRCPFPSQNRPSCRVGCQRVALFCRVLFQQPLSKLRMTVSVSRSSPVIYFELFPSDEQYCFGYLVSYLPYSSSSSDYLSPFALCMALPCSLVGRNSHDYYGDSVTIGLSSLRPSHVPSSSNVSSNNLGSPFMPLNEFITHRLLSKTWYR